MAKPVSKKSQGSKAKADDQSQKDTDQSKKKNAKKKAEVEKPAKPKKSVPKAGVTEASPKKDKAKKKGDKSSPKDSSPKDSSAKAHVQAMPVERRAGKIGETASDKRAKKKDADKLRKEVGDKTTLPKMQNDAETDMARRPDYTPIYAGSDRLKDRVALVTGGDSGIGRAICLLYAREGADISITYYSNREDALETARLVELEGRKAIIVQADLSRKNSVDKVVRETIQSFGKLDILVNNAGEQHPAEDIRDISAQQLRQSFATNIYSMFYLVQAALPHLKAGAAIINCSSVTMYQGSGNLLDYSATKGAITAFTRSLSANLAEKGIRVNGVAPGPIWTPLNPRGGASADKVESFGETVPMKRPGEPNEVAPSFLFLACEDSSYMSGQMLHPNGGTVVNG